MSTAKEGVQSAVKICALKGLHNVVISPGSRNAPLSIAFGEHKSFKCFQITDERVAAFFAMGLAQRTQKASIICCSSGTAVLNYAPAIAEAYYQRIPMIILTADRPSQWIDQGAGQSMNQRDVYRNYVLKSFQLPQNINSAEDLWHNVRIVNEAINLAHGAVCGPVHINIPLEEPLYEISESNHEPKIIHPIETRRTLTSSSLAELQSHWKSSQKKLIICGMLPKSDVINEKINFLASDPSVVVLSESHSNVSGPMIFPNIDRLLESISEDESHEFSPDLLISFGHSIISNKIKSLLQNMPIKVHWHIDGINNPNDTFKHLTHHIKMDPADFLNTFSYEAEKDPFPFQEKYEAKELLCQKAHQSFLNTAPFSDLLTFSLILPKLPLNSMLQMGNSASIRYVQLFPQRTDVSYYANRGVSGIEGCTSTACGSAYTFEGFTTLITGDLSFLYDSNGLWHEYVSSQLRIIVVNNHGGGIFRIINGPSGTNQFEQFFEAHHKMSVQPNADKFGLEYTACHYAEELNSALNLFYRESEKAKIIEVFTPREINDEVLKNYFQHIKQESTK